jgi:hypothetical protein
MMLAIGLPYIAFIMLRYIPSIPSFLRAFIMKWCWILPQAFSASIEMIRWFLYLLLLMLCITFSDFHMFDQCWIPGMKLSVHDAWSFWYVVGFSLPLCYWGFLHQCSLRRLACSSYFWMCPCLVWG